MKFMLVAIIMAILLMQIAAADEAAEKAAKEKAKRDLSTFFGDNNWQRQVKFTVDKDKKPLPVLDDNGFLTTTQSRKAKIVSGAFVEYEGDGKTKFAETNKVGNGLMTTYPNDKTGYKYFKDKDGTLIGFVSDKKQKELSGVTDEQLLTFARYGIDLEKATFAKKDNTVTAAASEGKKSVAIDLSNVNLIAVNELIGDADVVTTFDSRGRVVLRNVKEKADAKEIEYKYAYLTDQDKNPNTMTVVKEGKTTKLDAARLSAEAPRAQVVPPPSFAFKAFQFIGDVFNAYNEWGAGLGQLGALFIGEKKLEEQQRKVADLLCKTILLGGTQCWQSKICDQNLEVSPGSGVVVADVKGTPRPVAHIEAEKTLPGITRNATTGQNITTRAYRITYSIQNPDKDLTYNVEVSGEGRNFRLFVNDVKVPEGKISQRLNSNAIVQYSANDYAKLCLKFSPGIKTFGGGSARQVCNKIAEHKGGPELFKNITATGPGITEAEQPVLATGF